MMKRERVRNGLCEGEDRIKRAHEIACLGYWEWDYKTDKAYCSDGIYRILGIDNRKKLDSMKSIVEQFVHPEYKEMVRESAKRAIESGEIETNEFKMIKGSGEERWVRTNGFFAHDKNGDRANITGTIQDITEWKYAEKALQENLSFLQILIDTIPNPIFFKDMKGIYLHCNNAFAEYLGVEREKIVNHTVYDIAPKELADIYYKADQEIIEQKGKQTYESKVRYRDGSYHDVIFNKATILDEEGAVVGLVGVIMDITDRKKLEKELIKSSTTDYLTKIYNRTKFYEILGDEITRAVEEKCNLSVIMFDIDHFKKVNDNYGHDVGDKILIQVTELVEKLKRENDVFARWGGDEFMLLLKDMDGKEAECFAEEMRKDIEGHCFREVNSVTCSLGVAGFSEGEDIEKFLKHADEALYESKRRGRNCVSLKSHENRVDNIKKKGPFM